MKFEMCGCGPTSQVVAVCIILAQQKAHACTWLHLQHWWSLASCYRVGVISCSMMLRHFNEWQCCDSLAWSWSCEWGDSRLHWDNARKSHHYWFCPHRWMGSFTKCPICCEPFVLNPPEQQALSLPCGHTTCRSCMSLLQSAHCPCCRAVFAGNVAAMAPNYTLHEALASAEASAAAAATVSWLVHVYHNLRKIIMEA